MSGHGHVIPNDDGSVARCGGPGICSQCSGELAQLIISKEVKEKQDQVEFKSQQPTGYTYTEDEFKSQQPAVVKAEAESTNS